MRGARGKSGGRRLKGGWSQNRTGDGRFGSGKMPKAETRTVGYQAGRARVVAGIALKAKQKFETAKTPADKARYKAIAERAAKKAQEHATAAKKLAKDDVGKKAASAAAKDATSAKATAESVGKKDAAYHKKHLKKHQEAHDSTTDPVAKKHHQKKIQKHQEELKKLEPDSVTNKVLNQDKHPDYQKAKEAVGKTKTMEEKILEAGGGFQDIKNFQEGKPASADLIVKMGKNGLTKNEVDMLAFGTKKPTTSPTPSETPKVAEKKSVTPNKNAPKDSPEYHAYHAGVHKAKIAELEKKIKNEPNSLTKKAMEIEKAHSEKKLKKHEKGMGGAEATKDVPTSSSSSGSKNFKPMSDSDYYKATQQDYNALTSSQVSGIKKYSGHMYDEINGNPANGTKGLRNPPPGQDAKDAIAKMDDAFKNPASRMKQDAILYRGAGGKEFFSKMKVGGTFDDAGFVSTSMTTQNGFYQEKPVRFHISVPKGHPAIAMGSGLSHHSNEREILLPRGSKFKITHMEEKGGKLYVHAEVMPHE